MSPSRRICCCQGCLQFQDLFTRADSGTIGSGWVEISGVWSITSNQLKHDSTSPGMCLRKASNPYGGYNQIISAKIYGFADGTKHRLIAQANESGSEYFYAEWYYYLVAGTPTMDFIVGDESGPLSSITGGSTIAEGTTCRLVITDGGQLGQSDLSSRQTVCVTPKANKYAGVASVGVVGTRFDNWEHRVHEMDDDDCDSHDCSCEGYCVEDDLTAEFEELNECPNLDGVTHAMTNAGPIKFGSDWYTASTACPGVGNVENIRLKLSCTAGGLIPVESFRLDVLEGSFWRKSDGASYDIADPNESTCEPFSLRFGPFTYGNVSHEGPPPCPETMCCHGHPCDPDESDFYVWVYQ